MFLVLSLTPTTDAQCSYSWGKERGWDSSPLVTFSPELASGGGSLEVQQLSLPCNAGETSSVPGPG